MQEGQRVADINIYFLIDIVWGRPSNLKFSCEILTFLLSPWCRVLLEKLTGLQPVKKFPAFHGTRRFITALTNVRHLSLSWANPIQSIYPHPISWRSILILSTHLRLGLPNGLLTSGFPSKTLYTPLSPPIRATCPAHLILLDLRAPIDRRCSLRYRHCVTFTLSVPLLLVRTIFDERQSHDFQVTHPRCFQ